MKDLASTNANSPEETEETITPLHMGVHEHDQSGGGEFIGDGVRMHDQPLMSREGQG